MAFLGYLAHEFYEVYLSHLVFLLYHTCIGLPRLFISDVVFEHLLRNEPMPFFTA